MYTAVNGIYENGTLVLTETPPTTEKSNVVVLFLGNVENLTQKQKKGVKLGSLAGKISISDDFNAPLDDLKDYM